ncbi:hypothetical protein [Nocardia iowensis]|uniref:DUF8017 domain-containing protein n=1 Tax=Nocardia iowensis TaxID=204891 RepID=A0ABX8RRY2_NOCIO|nr:hypothetical protein [Nocardia iowensis]QXN92036.1 hypothetical protein KV110_02280 [Nocardia iowensis]
MSGFDDRRNDPTVLGRPGAAHPYQQQSSGAAQFGPAGSDDETAEQAVPARPWKRDSGFHEQVAWPSPTAGPGQPDPTVQWQPGASAPRAAGSAVQPEQAQPAPNYQWQPSPTGSGQPDPTLQWQPSSPAPTPQGQPGSSGQAPPTPQWQAPTAGRADPTLLAQPLSGAPAQPAPWQPPPAAPGQADPTLLAQPHSGEPAGLWQPSLGTPEPSQHGPGEAAPTLLGYPNATRLGQPDPTPQWQPAPAQYGEVPPIEQYRAPTQAAPQYGQPVAGLYAPQSGFGGPPHQVPPNHGASGPPPSGRGKTLLLIGLVVLLVAAGAVTAVTLAQRGSDNADAQGSSPSMVSALTTSANAEPTPSKTTSAQPTPNGHGRNETPVIPGYQVVVAPDRGAAYDVPAGWTIAPETAIGGFGEPPNAVAGKGYASHGKGYCPGSTRTVSFLTGSKDPDTAAAATELGTRTAKLAYTASSDGHPAPPVPLESLDGSQRGMFVETKGTVTKAKPGCATEYSVYTVAFPTENGSFVMVIAADTGVPEAIDTETAKRIFTSIRPHDN